MQIVILRFKVSPEKRIDLVKAVLSITGPAEARADCRSCRLYSETGDSDSLILLEEWISRESLERHIRSEDFRRILSSVELARSPPEISFYEVSSTAGMEFIEEVRGQRHNI